MPDRITPEEAHEALMTRAAEAMESVVLCLTTADAIRKEPSIIDPIVDRLVACAASYCERYRSGTPVDMPLLRALAVALAQEPLNHSAHDESEGYDCHNACLSWQDDMHELAGDGLADQYELEMLR